jgi:VCBS repeat-containing protein
MTDTTAPTLISFNQSDPSLTNASVVHYTLTFSEAVTGVDISDFTLSTSSVTGANIASVAPVSGSNGTQYIVTVNTGSGDGTVELDLSGSGIQDLAGNPLPVGIFQSQTTDVTGSTPYSVAIGDLNGDGKPDLVASNYGSNMVSVLLGNGDGTFQPQTTYATGDNPRGIAIADVNGDGRLDLVVANLTANTVSVLLGNGDGTFQPQTTYKTGGFPVSIAVGDVNGDGKPDLVVANALSGTVSVLLGNGDGTFQPQVTYATGSFSNFVAIGDLNGDGKPDLVVTNAQAGTVSVLLGNGDGTFQPQVTYATGAFPYSVAIGDLNGDGRPDLVTANAGANTVSVLLNNAPTFVGSTYTIDKTAPTVAITSQALLLDTGISSVDRITSDGHVTLTGTVSDNNAVAGVEIFDGTTDLGPATVSGGTWNFAYNLGEGTHALDAVATDAAGNKTITAAQPTIIVDQTAPVVKSSSTGGSISNPTQMVSGTVDIADAGTLVTLYDGTTSLGTVMVQSNGSWSDSVKLTGNGTHTLTAQDTDAAGNTGTSNAVVYMLTIPVPTVAADTASVAVAGTVTATAAHGVLANDTDPIPSDTLIVSAVDGLAGDVGHALVGSYGTLTLNGNGSYSYVANPTVPSNVVAQDIFTYTAADGYGGTATSSLTVTVTQPGQTLIVGTPGQSLTSSNGSVLLDASLLQNQNITAGNGNDGVIAGSYDHVVLGNGADVVQAGNNDTISLGNGTDTVSAGNGSSITLGNGSDTVIAGTNNVISVGNGTDTIYAAKGDTITVGNGHDTFLFGVSPGQTTAGMIGPVTINHFSAANDVIKIASTLGNPGGWDTSFSNLSPHITNDVHGNAVITLDTSGDTITLMGVSASSLHASDFQFV